MFNFFKPQKQIRYTATRSVTVVFNGEPYPTEHTAVTSTVYREGDEWAYLNRSVVDNSEHKLCFSDETGNRIIVPHANVKYIILGLVQETTEEVA